MTDEPRPEASIGLAELIAAIRCELEKADASRLDRAADPLLELREVELEIQFEVTRAPKKGKKAGELAFHVVSAGEASSSPGETVRLQRLRVLYGPAFKLVELEGNDIGTPDWLRIPVRSEDIASLRIQIDDEKPE
jgi:hypothetical protein